MEPVKPRLETPRTLITCLTQVASKLGITFRTVTTHRYNIGRKTGLQLNTDLARLAINAGLVSIDFGA